MNFSFQYLKKKKKNKFLVRINETFPLSVERSPIGFATLPSGIGLKNSLLFLNQSDAKIKSIATCSLWLFFPRFW